VRHLEIDDCFEGLSYCDYARVPLLHKPKREKFQEAMKDAGIESITDCYFVGQWHILKDNTQPSRPSHSLVQSADI
jgi:pyrimidine and pyridine-specific 5'-nucleotidase